MEREKPVNYLNKSPHHAVFKWVSSYTYQLFEQ